MTTSAFSQLAPKNQMDYLQKTAILIHRLVKGDIIVSLYWSQDFIFEVLNPKDEVMKFEIKCFDRFKYVHS
ncbi:MAG: hypothetical protein HC819_22635 [Cyclobacteriaceae bacterium]|nr:hypothetical protein [Cyclobacteriaceae bacterium]